MKEPRYDLSAYRTKIQEQFDAATAQALLSTDPWPSLRVLNNGKEQLEVQQRRLLGLLLRKAGQQAAEAGMLTDDG